MFTDQEITWEEHCEWFGRVRSAPDQKHFIYEYEKTPIGYIAFTRMSDVHSRCYWGFYIGEPSVPAGAGTEMCSMAIAWLFQNTTMNKICGEVLGSNVRSIRLHEKLGFAKEGILQKHVNKNGIFEDVYCFAIFNESISRETTTCSTSTLGGE
jgi:UDP-4-amino-4,6-dideoxy-N-acetyl-beta-L-altrosamine N-acetyltransferase